jgi:hypothetical protein
MIRLATAILLLSGSSLQIIPAGAAADAVAETLSIPVDAAIILHKERFIVPSPCKCYFTIRTIHRRRLRL